MIRITISGPIAVGKTTAGNIIEKALKAEGYIVERHLGPTRRKPLRQYKAVLMEETNAVIADAS